MSNNKPMSRLSMIRNGYHPRKDGCFIKLVSFEHTTTGNNHWVEQIVRSPAGNIIKVKTQNRRSS